MIISFLLSFCLISSMRSWGAEHPTHPVFVSPVFIEQQQHEVIQKTVLALRQSLLQKTELEHKRCAQNNLNRYCVTGLFTVLPMVCAYAFPAKSPEHFIGTTAASWVFRAISKHGISLLSCAGSLWAIRSLFNNSNETQRQYDAIFGSLTQNVDSIERASTQLLTVIETDDKRQSALQYYFGLLETGVIEHEREMERVKKELEDGLQQIKEELGKTMTGVDNDITLVKHEVGTLKMTNQKVLDILTTSLVVLQGLRGNIKSLKELSPPNTPAHTPGTSRIHTPPAQHRGSTHNPYGKEDEFWEDNPSSSS